MFLSFIKVGVHKIEPSRRREIPDLRVNEMFIEFRGSNFRGRVSTCPSFEGSDIFFFRWEWKFEEEKEEGRVLHLWALRVRTSGVHIQFLTRSDESAAPILK